MCVLQPQTDFVLQKFLLNCDILKSGPAPGPFWLQNLVSSSARAPCFQNKSVCFLFLREEISASSPAVMQPESNGGGAAPHLCCGGGRAATADRGDAQRARASWRRSLAANHAFDPGVIRDENGSSRVDVGGLASTRGLSTTPGLASN